MITFYADEIASSYGFDDPWNRYLLQKINTPLNVDPVTGVKNFTPHPQFSLSNFKQFDLKIEAKTFENYVPGKNAVIVGLHGGWTADKLKHIKNWFTNDRNRKYCWEDYNCKIILDYCEEGVANDSIFNDIHCWTIENNLHDRVLYVTSSYNANQLYQKWCYQNKTSPVIKISWYGFFVNWILPRDSKLNVINDFIDAKWSFSNRRYMCLNRRPWAHRVLLTTLLTHYDIIDKGTVSMPKDFVEPDINWNKEDVDIQLHWSSLKSHFNGYLDNLEKDFEKMYQTLPRIADIENFGINQVLDLNNNLYQHYPVNLISETFYFDDSVFFSEKIWKPILMGQIFIVMSSPGYLKSLRDIGFKTFHPYINEEYDFITDPVERGHSLVQSLTRLVNMSEVEFDGFLKNCKPIVEHNKKIITNIGNVNKLMSQALVNQIEYLWT